MIDTPHAMLVGLLQRSGSGAGKIQWGNAESPTQPTPGSPYYREAPEPMPTAMGTGGPSFPYVVFDVAKSTEIDPQFEGQYKEKFRVTIKIYCGSVQTPSAPPLVGLVSSPYQLKVNSVIAYLDSFSIQADRMNGDTFKVHDWSRENYEVVMEAHRDPSGLPSTGGRVWVGTAEYQLIIDAAIPDI